MGEVLSQLPPLYNVRLDVLLSGLLLAVVFLLALLFAASRVGGPAGASSTSTTVTAADEPVVVLPECIIDLDCGVDGYVNFTCWRNYVVQDYVSYWCDGVGRPNSTCVSYSRLEPVDMCGEDEMCVEGLSSCAPRTGCHDGVMDYGESGVDCGGRCGHCPGCSDGWQNDGEEGVDCGGPCAPCEVRCASNASCGLPRHGRPYCGPDGSVYRDYVSFYCVNSGKVSSYCVREKAISLIDYCGPGNRCVDGACAVPGRGAFRMPDYTCHPGDSCWTGDESYVTCRGSWCYEVRVPDADG